MAKHTGLAVEKRDFSKNPRQLRAEGKLPATVYGHNFDSVSL
ncbi:MAG TPA: 50S ribosomal protein L25, partial [Cyanobacteria bacterium UBA9579]|nr:50S ribosomal protein L25 [Cyanobacteria bacterium UBA9579]